MLLIVLAQGLTYLLLLPPWQHYEVPAHFEYAWLIANRGQIPAAGDLTPPCGAISPAPCWRTTYWNLAEPDPADDGSAIWIGGAEVGLQPPGYYLLVSVPLRLARHLDLISQFYIARLVSSRPSPGATFAWRARDGWRFFRERSL